MEDDEVDPLAAVDLQSLSLDELPTDESTRLMDIIPISKSWYNKIIWASTRENLSSGVCQQQRRRQACGSAQSEQCLCYSLIGKYRI